MLLQRHLVWEGFLKEVNISSFEIVHHRVDQAVQVFPILWMGVRNPEWRGAYPALFLSSRDFGAPALCLAL